MNKTFLLVDTQNCFHRAINVIQQGQIWDRVGLALAITLGGLKKINDKFEPDHTLFATEGTSWRKDYDDDYKANRSLMYNNKTDEEKEETQLMFDMIEDFISFVDTKTNSTVLRHKSLEADDLIARWIQRHPNDKHIILSTDNDFIQLLAHNVEIYNPVKEQLFTVRGVFESDFKTLATKKGEFLEIPDPELSIFIKCVRGDSSDNVFSAYPNARMKSTKKAVGILDAYEDRINKGYNWNSFMNTKWVNHEKKEIVVKDAFEHNKLLMDLTQQPVEIKEIMDEVIDNVEPKANTQLGFHFLKMASKYELVNISKYPNDYIKIFVKPYIKE